MHVLRTAALSLILLVMFAREARADSGDGAGVGPVIGMTWNGSLSLGWEVSGSLSNPLLRLAAGGSYHVTRAEEDPRYFHYLAWEPWLFAGATLGIAGTDAGDTRAIYGLWVGYARDLDAPLNTWETDFIDDDTRFHWVLTFSVGWRGIGGTQQFYFTPKVWHIQGWDFFT